MLNPALFPARPARQLTDDALTRLLAAAAERVAAGPVAPTLDLNVFRAELATYDFGSPAPLQDAIDWTVTQLEHGVVHMNHPRYLGLFNPAPSFPAQCADRIAAAFNPQLASATTSPAAVEIEAHVARAFARRAGLPDGSAGHFTSGGSEANFTALVCALTRAEPGFATTGARAFSGQPVMYISQDSHLAWIKIAHSAGIGRDACRQVATDPQGRMDMAALASHLASDRAAGCVPVIIVATAGTTNAGAIDPIGASAVLAASYGTWLHVDAAWGGGLLASDRLRPMLAGIERADSITVDAHKWFAATMGCGLFLTAHPEAAAAAFNVATSFMPSHDTAADPYTTTMQWSRRFLGLRMFLSLATAGWAGHALHVERAAGLAHALATDLAARGWTIANSPALAVVCTIPPPGAPPVRRVVAALLASGEAWVSAARFAGQDVVRACVTHGETSATDIARVAAALDEACRPDS